ncbi:hypothetical protein Rhopal_004640-T1 [Rhodotorula paludigena]|uniref:Uncharacterized protein n=1 Tax=Rhodotorula paludigena TaxID=86838 RepID=A0AAV5GQG9_9BASI|nr:hypothetical protein Rhopal_004640-T1 [Rhodotorula paludigena]
MAANPFSAAAKGWTAPEWSLESRTRRTVTEPAAPLFTSKRPLRSTTNLPFRPPDEEKGRSFRSSSQTQATTALFGAPPALEHLALGDADALIQPRSGNVVSFASAGDDEDDDFFDSWRADGGAQAGADASQSEDELPSPFPRSSPPAALPSSLVWTQAIDRAVFNADGNIQLSGQNLNEVPNAVWELSTLRALKPTGTSRMLSRTQSVPATRVPDAQVSNRLFGRTSSGSFAPFAASTLPTTTVPVFMMLSGNHLTTGSISNALWSLPNLQVLSLRNNDLDEVPEGIGRLVNLHELSLAGNHLQYLPAEILDLENLANLTLHPNPFLPPPLLASPDNTPASPSRDAPSRPQRRRRRLLGPLTRHYTVPSLSEIAQRVLLDETASSATSESSSATARNIQLYSPGVEYLRDALPAHLFAPFHSTFFTPSSPASTAPASSFSSPFLSFPRTRQPSSSSAHSRADGSAGPTQPFDPLSHVCRSPAHTDALTGAGAKGFVRPAVERIEWVSEASLKRGAGGAAGAAAGAKGEVRNIPIRWRGCGAACLDWLEEEEEDDGERQA